MAVRKVFVGYNGATVYWKARQKSSQILTQSAKIRMVSLDTQRLMRFLWLILCGVLIFAAPHLSNAQQQSTPIPVQPPTATATPPPPTEPPTRTPTSEGPASVEALNEGTNVRSQPDIGSEVVIQIAPGAQYPIIGRYFEWYQIEVRDASAGIGWIHQSVIRILGDERLIADLSVEQIPTDDPILEQRRLTAEAITATPGAVLTQTALALTPAAPSAGDGGLQSQIQDFGGTLPPVAGNAGSIPNPNNGTAGAPRLPTFTFPAETPTPINLVEISVSNATDAEGLAPIVPIMVLMGIGFLGLIIALLRRF